jgi:hypothetical protein
MKRSGGSSRLVEMRSAGWPTKYEFIDDRYMTTDKEYGPELELELELGPEHVERAEPSHQTHRARSLWSLVERQSSYLS